MRKEPKKHWSTRAGLRRASKILFFTLLLIGPSAVGQSADDAAGRLNSYACEKLTTPLKIDVQLTDNAPDLLKLKDKFTAQLKRDGIGVSAGGPLLLMLDIRTDRNIEQSEKAHIGRLQVGKGGGVSLRGKVWSNTGDSVLGGRKKTARQRTVDQLSLTATLNRRSDGRCIWRGEIVYDLGGRDTNQTATEMMPLLAGAIGRSIQNKPVEISD